MIKHSDSQFKVVIVGNQSVGKSSLLQRYCDGNFNENYQPTIGVDFKLKKQEVEDLGYSRSVNISRIDKRLLQKQTFIYTDSQAVLIVYDRTDPSTLKSVEEYWMEEAKSNSDPDTLIFLVGNKCDRHSLVSDQEINKLVHTSGLSSCFTVSAKSGEGVKDMFSSICQKLMRKNQASTIYKSSLKMPENQKKKCCQ